MNESITDLAQRLSRIHRQEAAPVQPAAEKPPAPPIGRAVTELAQRITRAIHAKTPSASKPQEYRAGWEEALDAAIDAAREALSVPPAADGLVPHGDPIDIGWVGGSLDARLTLSVRPGMDPLERDQLLADLRDALAPVVPVRRTGREVSS